MFKLRKSLVFIIAALTLVLAACGGNDSGDATVDKVLKNIKETKVLKVGTDATFKPFEYKSGGEFKGYDIELVEAIAKELGTDKVEFIDTEFKGLIPGLQAKKFDMIASAMYITDERKKTIDFSDTYFPGGLSIIVREENTEIQNINDLSGKEVAVQIGTKSTEFLETNYPDIHLVKVEKNTEMFLELESNKVEAVVTGLPAAKVYIKEHGKMKVLENTLTEEFYGFGIRKENTAFREAVNEALQTLKDNGTYDELTKKWFE